MLIDDARQVQAAAERILARVNGGSASCAEMREAMPVLKSASAMITSAQTSAAASIAGREQHRDGGVEVLATAAGLPIGEARSHIKTAETLRGLPAVRDAVESGRVSRANAKQLADAVEKAGVEAVEADGDLLGRAESMRPEKFKQQARRWTAERQGDHGASEHARQRARRRVRTWDGDGGMVHLHGEFDAVTGNQLVNRLRAEASRMLDADKKNPGGGRRSMDQCMADALDRLTATNSSGGGGAGGGAFADICVVAHVDDDTARLVGELPDGTKLPSEVLDLLTPNAKLTGLIYDRCGKPIWRTESRPTATAAQRQILNARWGGCFHCGTHFGICQPHHIEPVSRGGPTSLDNLVPACWECHNRIHRDRWWIRKCPEGNHTLHPPDPMTYGPACAPDEPALFKSGPDPGPNPVQPRAGPEVNRAGLAAARAALRDARAQREAAATTA